MTKIKNLNFPALLIAAFCVFNFNVSAQSTGFIKNSEKPLYTSESDDKCYVFNKYVVKTYLKNNVKDDIGTGQGYEIDVFKRDAKSDLKKSCETSADSLLSLKNEEGNELGGVFGDLFLISRNVFPDNADLDIYDLKTGKVVFTTEFSEWDGYATNISNGNFLNYRQWSKKDGLLKNCPQAKKWKKRRFGRKLATNEKIEFTDAKRNFRRNFALY